MNPGGGGGLFGAAAGWLGKAQEQAFSYIAPEQKGPQQLFEQAVQDGNRGEVHHWLANGQSACGALRGAAPFPGLH